MRRRNEEVEKGLATIDPLTDQGLQAALAESDPDELLSSILATPRPESERGYRSAGRRLSASAWRKPALLATPVAASVLLVLALGIPGGGSGGDTLPALARVAEAAAAQPAANLDFQYRYEKTSEINLDSTIAHRRAWSVRDSSTTERWIAKDGSGLERREVTPEWASPADKKAWEEAGRIHFLAHGWKPYTEEHEYGPGHFRGKLYVAADRPEPELSDLPTDPEKLATWIEGVVNNPKSEDNGTGTTVKAMTLVTDLLVEPSASPELRAALYQALGMIAGIEYFGHVSDAIGRHGVGVGVDTAYTGAYSRFMVILDPETSQVLASEQIWLKPPSGLPGEPGDVSSALLFLESRGANSLGG